MSITVRDKLRKAAILTALFDEIGKVKAAVRIDAREALTEARRTQGVKSVDLDLPDGRVYATGSLSMPKGDQLDIVDERAFLLWVANNHPEQLRVDYAFKRGHLNQLTVTDDGTVVQKRTGAVITHAAMVPAGDREPTLRIQWAPGGREMVAQAWQDGTLEVELAAPLAVTSGGDS